MAKLTEYPKATSFDSNDILIKDGVNGTKKIEIEDFIADVSDTTSTTDGKLAKAGDVAELKTQMDTLIPIDLADGVAVTNGKYINYSTGVEGNSTNAFCTDYIDVSTYTEILYSRYYTTSTSSSWGIFFYDSSKNPISDSGIRASLGSSEAHYELESATVPDGAKYVRLSGNQTLGAVSLYDKADYDGKVYPRLENLENAYNEFYNEFVEKVEEVDELLDETFDELYDAISLDLTENIVANCYILTNNTWSSTSGRSCGIVPLPSGIKGIRIKANVQEATGVAFLKTDSHVAGTTPDFASGWDSRYRCLAGTTHLFSVPDDAAFLYYSCTFNNVSDLPQSVVLMRSKIDELDVLENPLRLHELPENVNILNIIKRCRQLTDIKWTPVIDLPRILLVQRGGYTIPDTVSAQYYIGTFKAGVEYTGIPYGRSSDNMSDFDLSYATPGRYIDLASFVTSVSNPKSRLCETDISSASNHKSLLYAGVCSGLVCYALNVPEVATANIPNISGLTYIGKLNDNGVLLSDAMIKIGDVLNNPGDHAGIITDIIRDSNGTIQSVEISELTSVGLADRNYSDGLVGGIARRKGWPRELLYQTGLSAAWGDYDVYRYTKTVPYTSSQYVNVGDEFDGWRVDHFPIMPYEGEAFTYKTGSIPDNQVKLVIHLDGYAYARVFKDGTEISGSPFTVTKTTVDNVTDIDPILISEIGAGSYSAYLCNITNSEIKNTTYACHWSVI